MGEVARTLSRSMHGRGLDYDRGGVRKFLAKRGRREGPRALIPSAERENAEKIMGQMLFSVGKAIKEGFASGEEKETKAKMALVMFLRDTIKKLNDAVMEKDDAVVYSNFTGVRDGIAHLIEENRSLSVMTMVYSEVLESAVKECARQAGTEVETLSQDTLRRYVEKSVSSARILVALSEPVE